MDIVVPQGLAEAASASDKRRAQKSPLHYVVAGARSHPIIDFNSSGFVIEADGRPPLRGFADIIRGAERVMRGLVVCAWAAHGRVGYEFKREGISGDVPADYVRPQNAGLIEGPK